MGAVRIAEVTVMLQRGGPIAAAALLALSLGAWLAPRACAAPAYNANPILDQSSFALGTHTLNVIFVESDGTIDPDLETWTPEALATMQSKISEATAWWEGLTAGFHPNARLQFNLNYVNGGVPVATGYEPISRVMGYAELWIPDAMANLGYGGGDFLYQLRAFNSDQRVAQDTNWSTTIFVVNSINDPDGAFVDGSFAWSYTLPSPTASVLTYDNGAWGVEDFHRMLAHELGHHYGALDEYYLSGRTNVERRGYLNWLNGNAERDGQGNRVTPPEGTHKLMLDASLDPSSFTLGQVGQVDTDGDGVPDVLDTFPTLDGNDSGSDPGRGVFRFEGTASVEPTENLGPLGSGQDITINWIAGAEYRVNESDWTSLPAADGAFGAYEEDLELLLVDLIPGQYAIDLRVLNSVDNASEIYSFDFTSTVIPGDADFDGTVTFADFNALANHYGMAGVGWREGDFSGDGTVRFEDFNTLANHFGNSSVASGGAKPVPEPAAAAMLLGGLLALLCRWSRRLLGRQEAS
ncbi:MAG: hypothetical protein A2V70_16205 [Planctomycetes bacterium RBG_13_63_9]|nr:MAG: hypothetical protein A2V70_16205 [Planctomycetes bacterium RBG_13_63_9]